MKLNLGCGDNWKLYPDHAGLDIVDFGQEYVGDALIMLRKRPVFRKENSFDEIMANHFFEHFNQDELSFMFRHIAYMLKPDGVLKFVVPHKDRDKAWVLTHKTFWNEETIKALEDDPTCKHLFGTWKIKSLVVNHKQNIHAELTPVK